MTENKNCFRAVLEAISHSVLRGICAALDRFLARYLLSAPSPRSRPSAAPIAEFPLLRGAGVETPVTAGRSGS